MPYPRRKVPTVKVSATLERANYDDMARVMEREARWINEAAFVREAVIEKVRRHLAEKPGPAGPAPGTDVPMKRTHQRGL